MHAQLDHLATAGLDYLPEPDREQYEQEPNAKAAIAEAIAAGRRDANIAPPPGWDMKWWDREIGPAERALYARDGATTAQVHAALAQDMIAFPHYPPHWDIYGRRVLYLEQETVPPPAPMFLAVSSPSQALAVEPAAETIPVASPPMAPVMQSVPVPKKNEHAYGSRAKPGGGHDWSLDAVENMLHSARLPPMDASRLRFAEAKHRTAWLVALMERWGDREFENGIPVDIRASRLVILKAQLEYLKVCLAQFPKTWKHENDYNRKRTWEAERVLRTGCHGAGRLPQWQALLVRLHEERAQLAAEFDRFKEEIKNG